MTLIKRFIKVQGRDLKTILGQPSAHGTVPRSGIKDTFSLANMFQEIGKKFFVNAG